MKVFYEPKVYLVSAPKIRWAAIDQILKDEFDGAEWVRLGAAEQGEILCEFMGRLCYGSFGKNQGRKTTGDYITNILEQGHGSVLEHANYSFVVTRASRGFTHEMVRHRAGFAYSQESTRFCKYDLEHARVCLPGYQVGSEPESKAARALGEAIEWYERILGQLELDFPGTETSMKKRLRTAARQVLPTAIESKIGFSANLRALRHFCELRGAEDAAIEIRMVAAQVCYLMKEEARAVFADFESYLAEDGFIALKSKYRKV